MQASIHTAARPTARPGSNKAAPRRAAVVAAAARSPKERVVITGIGCASVFGNDPDTFYDNLLAGKSGITMIDRFDASAYPTKFAGQIRDFDIEGLIDAKNARRLDDCLKYTLVSGKKAVADAGLDEEALSKLDNQRVGVLVGSGMGGLTVFQDGCKALFEKGFKRMSPFFIPYAITNMGGALLAMEYGFMGPNYSISTACATANYAFHMAAEHIRKGDADMMIAGGSEAPIIPVGLGGFVACRALSTGGATPEDPTKASRPWDQGRDGFVMGEGAGVLVMESLEHAQKRGANIVAEYLGGALTCDAYHMTDPRADGLGVSSCINLALKDSGIEKEQVNYINCHATSTLVGDIAEVKAIEGAFGKEHLEKHAKLNATKSMIGHCLGAAGGMEAIATIKAITTGKVHPTLNQDNLIDEVANYDTCPEMRELEVTAGISNSFGFGGHNSVCVFGPYKE
ncbi:unnamed protein product [Pedinophyceae sp. YPF-701]|nr:unnamed protein product [Pedinophyceae sp. YPF-701]